MRCLVLGGAGFIGSHIVDVLVAKKHQVRVFDLPHLTLNNLRSSRDAIEMIEGDFDNENDIAKALDKVDVVVHLVCLTLPGPSNLNPIYDVEKNVISTLRLLNLAREHGIRKIVFASSGGTIYGVPQRIPIPETHQTNPICSYGITKLTIEKYLGLYHHLHDLEYTVLRLSNPYGERQRIDGLQGAVTVFLGNILLNKKITVWGDGLVERDYFHISELASLFVRVCEEETKSEIYNIGSGKSYSLNELLQVITRVTGESPSVEYTSAHKSDVLVNCLDISRAREEIGWNPSVSLEEGISRTWEWLCKAKLSDLTTWQQRDLE